MEWLGLIPEKWETKSIKSVLAERKEKNDPIKTNSILSLTMDRGVIPYAEKGAGGNKAKEDLTAYRLAYPGDIVLNSMNVVVGSVGLSKYFGAVSPVYYMLHPRKKDDLVEYFDAIFQNEAFQKSLVGLGNGILVKKSESSGKLNTIRMRIPMSKLNMVLIPYPSPAEQIAIAAFLDRKTAQIDQAVAIKEKQIALLKERKQILIQNAVTRGLNPDAPMRDSGVEWIGEIPAHWAILANRVLFRERIEPGEDGLPLLSVSIRTAVSSEEISEDENIRGRIKIEDKTKYNLVQPDDIVFNMMRAWQGAIGAVKVKGMVSPAYIIAIPNEKIESSYFEYQYRCPEFIQQMDRYSKGITDFRKRLYWGEFKQLATIVPPVEEQTAIVAHIETESAKIDKAIAIQQQQIDKLKEYKATLINSAVTGKIKIPELVEAKVATS